MGFARNIGRDRAVLAGLLERLGLPITLVSPLFGHADAVATAADRLGLIAAGDRGTVVPRHTADSLLFALARAPQPGERWIDVGSGAGFPGLVLACCYPETNFTLCEPALRKAGFLELQVAELGLGNAAVDARRAQGVGHDFDVAVARALASPTDAMLALISRVRIGGVALVAAGAQQRVPPEARMVRVDPGGVVDSPGTLFMMSREA